MFYTVRNKKQNYLYHKHETLKVISNQKEIISTCFVNRYDRLNNHCIVDSTLFKQMISDLAITNNIEKEKINFKVDTTMCVSLFSRRTLKPLIHYQKILNLVKENERAEIIDLCKSVYPEERAYGFTGLIELTINGIELSTEEKELFEKSLTDDTRINFVHGCTIYKNGITIKEFTNFFIDKRNYIERLKNEP